MQGMAVSESQPSMSHEQLVSNRDGEIQRFNHEYYFGFSATFLFVCALERGLSDFQRLFPVRVIFESFLLTLNVFHLRFSSGEKAVAKRT